MRGASSSTRLPVNARETSARYFACFGGSMPRMNIVASGSTATLWSSETPERFEYASVSLKPASTSACFESAQKPRVSSW